MWDWMRGAPRRATRASLVGAILSLVSAVVMVVVACTVVLPMMQRVLDASDTSFTWEPLPTEAVGQCERMGPTYEGATGTRTSSYGCLVEPFPVDIPLVDGDVAFSSVLVDGTETTYSVWVTTRGLAEAEAAISTAFTDAGWTPVEDPEASLDSSGVYYTGSSYQARVAYIESEYGPTITYRIDVLPGAPRPGDASAVGEDVVG